MSAAEIQREAENPYSPMIDRMIGSIVVAAVAKADHQRLEFILNRLIGKVKESVVISQPDAGSFKLNYNLDGD